MHRLMNLAALSAALLLLGGCDLRERFHSADDRINAAVPLAVDVQQGYARLLDQLAAVPADRTTMDNAWLGRLRARATSCSPDYTPTWRQSTEQVRAGVANKACFADFDRKLVRWVAVQRTRLLLAQPPLEVATLPPSVTVQGQILAMSSKSPVVAFSSSDGLELVALDSGRSLFKERGASGQVSLSPNGRLFAQSVSGGVSRIRTVEGGETLLELADARSVHWLSPWFIAVRSASSKPTLLVSLNTGDEVPVIVNNVGSYSNDVALPVPGSTSRFNLLSFTGLYQLEAQETGGRLAVTAVAEKPGVHQSLMAVTSGGGRLSADGRNLLVEGTTGFARLDLTTLDIQETSFQPMSVSSITAAAKPDVYVLDLRAPMESPTPGARLPYLYDAAAGTLARLEGPDAERPLLYVPGVGRVARLSLPTVWWVDRLQVAEAQRLDDVLNAQREIVNQARLDAVQLDGQRPARAGSSALGVSSSAAAPVAAPLLAGLRDPQVEGVGIYEAAEKIAQPGQSRSAGRVTVAVRPTAQPLVLVLSSYEPVQWMLKLEPGARLAAVLVAGYYDSSVLGAGDVRVLKIGRHYAYQPEGPEYAALQREVSRWAGRSIGLFQNGYKGSSFTVGGR